MSMYASIAYDAETIASEDLGVGSGVDAVVAA
jgi:hypothetical protein